MGPIWLHLRHPKTNPLDVKVIAITKDFRNGPYYLFNKEDRNLNYHVEFFPKLKGIKFEYFKNVKIDALNDKQLDAYMKDGEFFFKGKSCRIVQHPDEESSSKYLKF